MVPEHTPEQAQVIEVDIETPDGHLRGKMGLPIGRMRLSELAFNAMPVVEQLVAQAVGREKRDGRAISCRAGCGACCRQLVPVSPPEAWMVADLLASAKEPRRSLWHQRFATVRQRLADENLMTDLLTPPADDASARRLGLRYFLLQLACPFLDPSESCSIHPVRPAACREFLVTSPAEHCAQPADGLVRRVTVHVRLTEALARLTAELLGGEPKLIPLSLAPAWAVENEAAGQMQWEGAAMMRRLLELMSGAAIRA